MVKSMTSYGRATSSCGGKEITVEIKSVNSRYLDLSIKISRVFSFLEERVREYIQQKGISRGKVDLYIGVDVLEDSGVTLKLDEAYAESYVEALRALREKFLLADDVTTMTVAQNKDIFTVQKPEEDAEEDWKILVPVLDEAIDVFLAGREREGEKLKNDIALKKANLLEMTSQIENLSKESVGSYAQKLEARIRAALEDNKITVDEQRILTEVAIFADKVAVDEETVRLRSHFDEFDKIIASDDPVGRKLDFLLQEMNRETNTIGSKANNAEMAHIVVNMKNELEKIREQIQNLE